MTITNLAGGSVLPEATGTSDRGATMTLSAVPDERCQFVQAVGSDNDDGICGSVFDPSRGNFRKIVTLCSNRNIHFYFESKSK